MIKQFITYPIQFILLVLIQVTILNNVQFSAYINPFLYVIFLLTLPIETPKFLLLLLAFTIGISVDIFSNTLGMHASASIFLAFCRPSILKLLAPRDGYEINQRPTLQNFGFKWFISYSILLICLHHIFLFTVEIFRFDNYSHTLGRAFLSSAFTLLLVIIYQLFSYNSDKRAS